MKIGDLVEIFNSREKYSPMTERFGGTIGVIIDVVKVTTFADNSAPAQKFVVLLQDKQREYWFDEVELKVIN
jgi:hypothetical protein